MKLIIHISGGMASEIMADTSGIEVLVIDHDTEMMDEEDDRLMSIPDGQGGMELAIVSQWLPRIDPDLVDEIWKERKEAVKERKE